MEGEIRELFGRSAADWFEKTLGEPTKVQKEAWKAIAQNRSVLVSAPTGTGKTLSAFLLFIDRLTQEARQGTLKEELKLIYISPLKSLAADIRENLRPPLLGMKGADEAIRVGIRTGDTPQKERQRMYKHPPHILITTPESLFLLLTSKNGQAMLKTAKAIILDEMHALIDTKRGAHLLLSVARLDRLCGQPLQRIGLSATIEPQELAAKWLSPEEAVVVAPSMEKKTEISVVGMTPSVGRKKDPVWEELSQKVYARCREKRSVIAFCECRRYAEKLAYFVNQLAGEDFARVHHGSLSKEQHLEAELALREGRLRLLCATSSMELGIDVGDIDEVLQVGCPRTVSSTMQRLGRAGHNPGRVSVMEMYPRTAMEALSCGLTAALAKRGMVEEAHPPRECLDVLAQHLVSMAAIPGALGKGAEADVPEDAYGAAKRNSARELAAAVMCAQGEAASPSIAYGLDDVMEILRRAWPFVDVSRETVRRVLCMLAGDYEHNREIPVRPRVLYDRIHEVVYADAYSRMLAVAAGGTIPDKGMYTAKTLDGVQVGELDEEFVYESCRGDRFLLGACGWKIVGQDKDTVFVEPAAADSAKIPFWKGEAGGRSLKTSLAFGKLLGKLAGAESKKEREEALKDMGLDEAATQNVAGFLERQMEAAGMLPDDKTVLIEHFCDSAGCWQMMIHSRFGRRINGPLLQLLLYELREKYRINAGGADEEDGIVLYAYGEEKLPEGLLWDIRADQVRPCLEALLYTTPLFSMTFRYNAARALMMGMKRNGRQPLWMQRLRSTEMLDGLIHEKEHPLIAETRRECLEDLWDIDGLLWLLSALHSGLVAVREIALDTPSPMSLPFQWQVEAAEMYAYTPSTPGIHKEVFSQLERTEGIRPDKAELENRQTKGKLPENSPELHALLMAQGDLCAGELDVPIEWLEELERQGRACYIEPGLWIAAEQKEEYEAASCQTVAAAHILRRMLYDRGGVSRAEIAERYVWEEAFLQEILQKLQRDGEIVEDDGFFYHAKHYERAQRATLQSRRQAVDTQPDSSFAALCAMQAAGKGQLREALEGLVGRYFPAALWEDVLLPARVKNYRGGMLDSLLSEGDFYWKLSEDGRLAFWKTEDADWDRPLPDTGEWEEEEQILYETLKKRGASFTRQLSSCVESRFAQTGLLALAQKGLVCADSFVPVRQWLDQDKIQKATARQRVNARLMAQSAGRWDLVRPQKEKTLEEWIEHLLQEQKLLCRETWRKPEADGPWKKLADSASWLEALSVLRVWEYVGKVRRGYFVLGLSGAQFVRSEDFAAITRALCEPTEDIRWLNAQDPAQVWGKALAHREGRGFLNVPGTVVALKKGEAVAVFEKKGKTLRVFDMGPLREALCLFAEEFKAHRLYAGQKRLVLREYPKEAADALKGAGFQKEMQDFVLYG